MKAGESCEKRSTNVFKSTARFKTLYKNKSNMVSKVVKKPTINKPNGSRSENILRKNLSTESRKVSIKLKYGNDAFRDDERYGKSLI